MKKLFQKVTLVLGLFCFAATVILMMIAVEFDKPKYQLAGVIAFLLMWVFSTLNNICYGKED